MGTAIEWTDETWNPVTGCSKVSPGCAYCYAERVSSRYGFTSLPWTPANAGANVVLHPERLDKPLRWRRPRRIFVNSMSDLFHELVPDAFIDKVWATMTSAPQHTFQVLTKRAERMHAYLGARDRRERVEAAYFDGLMHDWSERLILDRDRAHDWPLPNVWLGVSAESQRWADARIPLLLETPAAVRFVSAEPLLGPLDLAEWLDPVCGLCGGGGGGIEDHLRCPACVGSGEGARPRLDWVIVGGESGGPADRRLWPISERDLGWVRSIRDQCGAFDVAFLFKQWGGAHPTSMGRLLDGRTWDQYPTAAVPA